MAVNGALLELTKTYNWEKFGIATPDDAAELMWAMWIDYQGSNCMIGSVYPYITDVAPTGTLPCDGSTFNRVDYPTLYARLAAEFIIDADTFVTPDLRGRTVIGVGTGSSLTPRSVNEVDGFEAHVLIVTETPYHTHLDTGHTHADGIAAPNITTIGAGAPQPTAIPAVGLTGASSANLTYEGADGAHNNMQPFVALNYCVVAQ